MRFLFISLLVFAGFLTACKNENKIQKYSIEELNKREYDSVKKLLFLSKTFMEKEQYEKSKENLTIMVNNYGTYQEVIEARKLLEALNLKILSQEITKSNSIDTIKILIKNVIDPDLVQLSSNRIKDLILNSLDISQIENYVNEDGFKEHQVIAQNRLQELNELRKEEAFKSAVATNTSDVWKKFLSDYPNHSNKKDIEKQIIMLEVNEIFAGDYGEIPLLQLVGDKNYQESSIEIKNDTKYTLTLRYSGKDVIRLSIPPQSSRKVNLKSGEYRVTASVDAADVRNFAGIESLSGSYSSNYYISSSRY